MNGGAPDEPHGPIAWMAKNNVAANLLMLFFLVGGLFAFTSITQELFPDLDENIVSISVSYPGASPEEVEKGIVLAVEEALTGIADVEEINSSANEGAATITVTLLEKADSIQAYQDIKSEIDRISTFPEDAERPEVTLQVHRREVLAVALYGDASEIVLKSLAEQVRDQLLEDPNITQVDVAGARDLEISISVPQENLRRYNLTLQQIATALDNASVDLPGGGLKTASGEILVRVNERRDYGREFGRIPILTGADGTQVLLEDVAVVEDGLEDSDVSAVYNGKPAVLLEVYRVGDQTPIQVADATKTCMKRIEKTLPDGIHLVVQRNMADTYWQRASLLLKNGVFGLVLVFLLLGAFLELRLAFWVMMGIPVSFLGSLVLMPALGLSINMMTMFAYLLALGIVVDDAIVVGENIYRLHQEGASFLNAAIRGTIEVGSPVAFSILTNMVAFVPLMILPGMMGRVMGMIPVVVISVFAISWIEAIFILPAHLGHHQDRPRTGLAAQIHNRQKRFSNWFMHWVRDDYAPFLEKCLLHRYLVVAVACAILMLTIGYMISGRLGFETFPRVESDYAYAEIVLPYGSPVERTEETVRHVQAAAQQVIDECGHPELVTGTFAHIGQSGSHSADIRVYLADPKIRNKIMGTQEFVNRWREKIGQVKGVEYIRLQSDRGGPGSGSALTVELTHSHVETLEKAAVDLAEALTAFPQVSDIDDGFQRGKEQLSFELLPLGRSLGLTARSVAQQIRGSYEGVEVVRQLRGRDELKIKVRLPKGERISEGRLSELMLKTPSGGEVPIQDAVRMTRGRAYTSITHRNSRRTMTVTADVRPRSDAGRIMKALDDDVLPTLKRRYPGLNYSYQGHQAEDQKSMKSLWMTIPMVLIAIYALLAVPFRSYMQPLIVMMSIPFGLVGAVAGHLIMGYSLSMVGVIGIVALSGVVVNDALVLIDFINARRSEGMTAHDAVVQAGVQRFRPILLTTLTTFGGLAPMIFETSRQARFLIPMALSLGYGLLFATMITLVLIPSLYMILEDVRRRPS